MAHGGVCTQVHSIYMAKILGKTFIKTRRLLMTRFSISFTDEEYSLLENIRGWYEDKTGLRVSRCSVIKRLLFLASDENGLFQSGFQNKTSKIVSKPEIIGQNGS
jgi:hypothetical protein